jgi:outer membrane biosynthesis protein TonB
MERPGEPLGDGRAVTSRPVYVPAGTTFLEFQVESAVTPAPGSEAPRYPDALRSAGVEGEVLAQFVVGPEDLVASC